MGGAQSADGSSSSFSAVWAELPDAAKDEIAALAGKDSTALLKPHPKAPPAAPPVPLGTKASLDHTAATAALTLVPRLQRKHYETIPKTLTEAAFWEAFFSHATVIVTHHAKALLVAQGEGDAWRCAAPDDSFTPAWEAADEAARAKLAALAAAESEALLTAAKKAPPPFPAVPLGTTVAISERAAVAALTLVPGLQKRQYALVPRRLDEKAFWVNFFSHATCLLAPKK